jgi:predicted nucleic acid-binding Zn ribbon protein
MVKLEMPEELRAYFRACNTRRRRADRQCEVCGTSMPNALLVQRYCSNRCAQRASRQRRRAEQPDG